MSTIAHGSDRAWVIHAFGKPDAIGWQDGKEVDVYESDPIGATPEGKDLTVVNSVLVDTVAIGNVSLAPLFGFYMLRCPREVYSVFTVTYSASLTVESVTQTATTSSWLPSRTCMPDSYKPE